MRAAWTTRSPRSPEAARHRLRQADVAEKFECGASAVNSTDRVGPVEISGAGEAEIGGCRQCVQRLGPEVADVRRPRRFPLVLLRRSLVMESADRVVFEEELGEERDGEVDLASPRGPDETLLEKAVAMW